MTAEIRIPTHTTHRDSFGTDLSISARAGLTSGLTLGTDPALAAELAYRREALQRRHARRRAAHSTDDGDGNLPARRPGTVTRWTSWLQSAPRRRSSGATVSCTGSGS
jgi:hypothetical protein